MSPKKRTTRDDGLLLQQEQAEVLLETRAVGAARVGKRVQSRRHDQSVPRSVERAEVERVEVVGDDSGEVWELEDGSLSIPLFEEEVVVTTRLVVRERVVVRKTTVVEEQLVSVDLRSEHLAIDADDGVVVHDPDAPGAEVVPPVTPPARRSPKKRAPRPRAGRPDGA